MAQYTPNFNLYEPDSSDDFADFRTEFNNNMNIIDQNLGGGGSGGHTIYDKDGNALAQESGLQFTGAVNVTDDNVNGRTVVDVSGGSNLILDAQIYSDTEKVVGVWRDNKPLYKKTAHIQNISISANSDTTLNISDYFSNVESAINYECCEENGEAIFPNVMVSSGLSPYSIGVTVDKASDHIIFTRGGGGSATISVRFTLYYTKTTDTAGSGGYEAYGFSPVIYSDVERCIGVWRDNKPLYQKTLIGTYNSSATSFQIDVSALDIDKIGNAFLSISSANYMAEVQDYYSSGSDHIRWYYEKSNNKITLEFGNTYPEKPFEYRLTIQYTKTTDVAGSGDYNTYGVPTIHYSTSEQVIGTWITGKPLYEITVEVNSVNIRYSYNSGSKQP